MSWISMMWRFHGCCQTIFKDWLWILLVLVLRFHNYDLGAILTIPDMLHHSGYIEHTPQFPYQVPAHLRGGWFQIITPLAAIAPRQALLLHHFFNSLHSFVTYVFTQTYFLMRCWIQFDADANSLCMNRYSHAMSKDCKAVEDIM